MITLKPKAYIIMIDANIYHTKVTSRNIFTFVNFQDDLQATTAHYAVEKLSNKVKDSWVDPEIASSKNIKQK